MRSIKEIYTEMAWEGIIRKYREFLPVTDATSVISMHIDRERTEGPDTVFKVSKEPMKIKGDLPVVEGILKEIL